MRIGWFTLVTILAASLGLTVRSTGELDRMCMIGLDRITARLERYLEPIRHRLPASDVDAGQPVPGPTYVLVLAGDGIAGLDGEGRVTWLEDDATVGGLPVLTGFESSFGSDCGLASSPEVVLGLGLVRALGARPLLATMLSEVDVEDIENPRVILSRGTVVEFGQGDLTGKIDRLNQVMIHAARLDMAPRRIDLRFGRQVILECDRPHRGSDKEV